MPLDRLGYPATESSTPAGIGLFELARRMGASVEQIEETYGHPLPDAVAHERGLADTYDACAEQPAVRDTRLSDGEALP